MKTIQNDELIDDMAGITDNEGIISSLIMFKEAGINLTERIMSSLPVQVCETCGREMEESEFLSCDDCRHENFVAIMQARPPTQMAF